MPVGSITSRDSRAQLGILGDRSPRTSLDRAALLDGTTFEEFAALYDGFQEGETRYPTFTVDIALTGEWLSGVRRP